MLMRNYFQIFAVVAPILILGLAAVWTPLIWLFILVLPIIGLGVIDMVQKKHAVRRLYPFFGRFRYWLEAVRPVSYTHLTLPTILLV